MQKCNVKIKNSKYDPPNKFEGLTTPPTGGGANKKG